MTALHCSRFLNVSNIALAFTNVLRLLWLVGAALFQASLAAAIIRATTGLDEPESNGDDFSRAQSFKRLYSNNDNTCNGNKSTSQGELKFNGGAPAEQTGLSQKVEEGAPPATAGSEAEAPVPLVESQGIEPVTEDLQGRLEEGDARALQGRMTELAERAADGGKGEGIWNARHAEGLPSDVDADLAAGEVARAKGDSAGSVDPRTGLPVGASRRTEGSGASEGGITRALLRVSHKRPHRQKWQRSSSVTVVTDVTDLTVVTVVAGVTLPLQSLLLFLLHRDCTSCTGSV